jgi:hypothetical protein
MSKKHKGNKKPNTHLEPVAIASHEQRNAVEACGIEFLLLDHSTAEP